MGDNIEYAVASTNTAHGTKVRVCEKIRARYKGDRSRTNQSMGHVVICVSARLRYVSVFL